MRMGIKVSRRDCRSTPPEEIYWTDDLNCIAEQVIVRKPPVDFLFLFGENRAKVFTWRSRNGKGKSSIL